MSSKFKITSWEGSSNMQIRTAVGASFLDGEDAEKLKDFFAPKIRESVMDEFGILYGEDAKRFNEMLKRPEPMNERTKAMVKRAQEIAATMSHDPNHDAAIRKDEREKVLVELLDEFLDGEICYEGDFICKKINSLRQQEQPK